MRVVSHIHVHTSVFPHRCADLFSLPQGYTKEAVLGVLKCVTHPHIHKAGLKFSNSRFTGYEAHLLTAPAPPIAGMHRPVLPLAKLRGRGHSGRAEPRHLRPAVPVPALQPGHPWGRVLQRSPLEHRPPSGPPPPSCAVSRNWQS